MDPGDDTGQFVAIAGEGIFHKRRLPAEFPLAQHPERGQLAQAFIQHLDVVDEPLEFAQSSDAL